jgi:hypothetical protein
MELGVGVHKLLDKPRTRYSVHLDVLAGNPFHKILRSISRGPSSTVTVIIYSSPLHIIGMFMESRVIVEELGKSSASCRVLPKPVRLLLINPVAVEKLAHRELAEIASRQEALQTISPSLLDIFYHPVFDSF